MHHHIRLKCVLLSGGQPMDNQLSGAFFDSYGFGSETNVDAKFPSSLDELINEIRVEKRKRA
jgi:hypothetical protein